MENSFLSFVAYKDGVFAAAGGAGARLTSSDFGLTWNSTGSYYSGHLRSIAAGNGLFIAVGHDWNGNDLGANTRSSDGETWSDMDESPGGEFATIAFGDGVFVATGAQRCSRTVDGLQWNDCGLAIGSDILDVKFVAG